MSRLADSIRRDIRLAADDNKRWLLRLRLASICARSGDLNSAQATIAEARSSSTALGRGEILAALNFAESLVAFHSSKIDESIDKARRCVAISSTVPGGTDSRSAALAWIAHCSRNLGRWPELISSLRQFMDCQTSEPETLARFCLVAADSLLEIDRLPLAERWYTRARGYANQCGDDALIAALIQNRAFLRTHNLRLREITTESVEIDECLLSIEEASARSYASYTQNSSHRWMLDFLKAQVLVTRGMYKEALEAFGLIDEHEFRSGWSHLAAVRDADVCLCQAEGGAAPCAVMVEVRRIRSLLESLTDPGDLAVVLHRLGRCATLSGELIAADELRVRRDGAYANYIESCSLNGEILVNLLDECKLPMSSSDGEVRK